MCVCALVCELEFCSVQVAVLKSLDHPNLLRFIGVLCNESKEGKVLNIITGKYLSGKGWVGGEGV